MENTTTAPAHTPGSWIFKEREGPSGSFIILGPEGHQQSLIAEYRHHGYYWNGLSKKERLANGKLMAAAPLLLESLKICVKELRSSLKFPEVSVAVELAEQVIAQAQ